MATTRGLVLGGLAEFDDLPVVTVDVTPGWTAPGGITDVLATASNLNDVTLPGLWLGLVLPPGAGVRGIFPPSRTIAVSRQVGRRTVIRCRLGELTAGSCVGLDVTLTVPRTGASPPQVTAFVTVATRAVVSLTARQPLPPCS